MTFKRKLFNVIFLMLFVFSVYENTFAQHSVARKWNETMLEAIRDDFARPTVHSRNLFHVSVAMYDAWSAYDDRAQPFLLGQEVKGFGSGFDGVDIPANLKSARSEAISYACYRLLTHRFKNSPGANESIPRFDGLMDELGYDVSFTSKDYSTGPPAALGNYIAQTLINFGLQDGSNEAQDYLNLYYEPNNPLLTPTNPGNPNLFDPNRWQPLAFDFFIDQAGFEIVGGIPEFLSPEWGRVVPFALSDENLNIYKRNGDEYWIYHDPGAPSYLEDDGSDTSSEYIWGHSLVSVWSSHLDPSDGVMIDISPASIGNVKDYPTTLEGLRGFYKLEGGGDLSIGYITNPHTESAYEEQIVPRGDYARVLAEFWADGPDSETPPEHWFTILNHVNDHPLFEKKFKGEGNVLDNLEWDVKAYFTLAGAVHDAAITAWGIKGWYDYIRPISSIRYMAGKGQSSDETLPNFNSNGIPLQEGFIEMIAQGDPLAGENGKNVGKIKLKAWKGHNHISDPETEAAGVGWILADNWWPYQRPSFVTPPFAGYISGHSTFSRAAAEVMTLLTGDEYFPGGMGEFFAGKNKFLVFEEGPSMDITLQWAKYYDASDQCSLSRIWGGIHPPVDDIPGRLIGQELGISAFKKAEEYFIGKVIAGTKRPIHSDIPIRVYPNPAKAGGYFSIDTPFRSMTEKVNLKIMRIDGGFIFEEAKNIIDGKLSCSLKGVEPGLFIVQIEATNYVFLTKVKIL